METTKKKRSSNSNGCAWGRAMMENVGGSLERIENKVDEINSFLLENKGEYIEKDELGAIVQGINQRMGDFHNGTKKIESKVWWMVGIFATGFITLLTMVLSKIL